MAHDPLSFFGKNHPLRQAVALTLGFLAGCGAPPREAETPPPVAREEKLPAEDAVYVNGVAISADARRLLEHMLGTEIRPGRYWYDTVCGAAGMEGQPTARFLPAGLQLGGPLQPNASHGTSSVFINGRELTIQEVVSLKQLVAVVPGRYWLDATGNAGFEGGPAVCNLIQLARSSQSRGSSSWRSNTTGIGVVSDGDFVGVIGQGLSVTTGN